jgi:hypothetical protein
VKPSYSSYSIHGGRAAVALLAGGLLGVGLLSAGCSKSSQPAPAPSTSSTSSSSVSVQPTEKGAINMPPRAFNEGMNAADGILALESEGYNVSVNWGAGRQDQSLSLCRIGSVDGMRGSGAVKPGTTVYVTVICS